MKYMLLIHNSEQALNALSGDELNQMKAEFRRFTEEIRTSGHYCAGSQLQPTSMATCSPKSISPTTSVPIVFCTTARHPVTSASNCCKVGDRSRRRSRRCLAATRTKAWVSTSAI